MARLPEKQRLAIIMFTIDELPQKQVAEAYISQLGKSAVFKAPIVTKVEIANSFFPAENYHQDYATLHPEEPYISFNDLPKLKNLKGQFPSLYRAKPVLVGHQG